jgi:hypothetical protein
MYIDEDFFKKVVLTDTETLSTREQLKLEIKKRMVIEIKAKQSEYNDSLVALKENKINIETADGKIKELLEKMYVIPDDSEIVKLIKSLRESARQYYYIQYFNSILEGLGITGENKDKLINNYIFLCECLSVTVIAGAMEAGFTSHSWIYYTLYNFLVVVKNTPGVNTYIIIPAITVYLYTNMDTLYLATTTLFLSINELLSIILCTLTSLSKTICGNDIILNDDKSNASNLSIVSAASNSTLKTVSTFPSLKTLLSDDYINMDYIDNDGKTTSFSEKLKDDLGTIITQSNTSSIGSQQFPLSYSSQTPPQSPGSPEKGGGRRKYKTKKHKKHTKKSAKISRKNNKRVKRSNKKTKKPKYLKNRRNNHTKK